jgi:hypothetical protein
VTPNGRARQRRQPRVELLGGTADPRLRGGRLLVEEIDTSGPTSRCRTSITLRVETPCTYISASARRSACSVREPFLSALG